MRKLWVALLILGLTAGVSLMAQEHPAEKKAGDEITVGTAVNIAGKVLEPGKYRVSCDKTEITFTRVDTGEKTVLPCKGKQLDKKAEHTALYTTLSPQGVRVVDRLLIRGSNVEHVF